MDFIKLKYIFTLDLFNPFLIQKSKTDFETQMVFLENIFTNAVINLE